MQALYPYFLIVHLCSAIIFLGFIFTDVFLMSLLKKTLGEDENNKIMAIIMKRGIKIMPLCVVLLVVSGGAMMSQYLNSQVGFFETNLQKLLMIKICIALFVVILVLFFLSFRLILKKPTPLGKYAHSLVLFLGFCIVILAKLAFYV